MNKHIWTFVTLFLCGPLIWAQRDTSDSGGPLMPEQAAYDVTFYELDLTIAPEQQTISGSNRIAARIVEPLSVLVLDFDSRYTIDSLLVEHNGVFERTTYERKGSQMWLDMKTERLPGTFVTALVFYHGQPRVAPNPPWNGGFTWSTTPSGEPWVSVSCQNQGADIWWPCKDHPSDEPDSMALHFTVPENLVCVSNGSLRTISENQDGTSTFFWFVSTPINNYGVSFYLAPFVSVSFEYKSSAGERMAMLFYYLPENRDLFRAFSVQIPQHVRFLEDLLGPYPFRVDKYAAVEAPYLGMEHQSCIAYGNYRGNGVFGYDQGFDALHFHELSHEWWGNMLTASDWKDFWLHEGFATYMEALYAGYLNGQTGYDAVLSHFRGRISNEKPIAPPFSQTTNQIYSGDIYFKGAWVLHTLRYLVGDDLFFESLQRFLYPDPALRMAKDGSHCRLVSSEEFIDTVERVTGQKLDWFFQVYLREAKPPVLKTWIIDDTVHLEWNTVNGGPFPMPVPVKIGNHVHVADMSSGYAALKLEPFVAPQIDPDNRILMRVDRVSFAEADEHLDGFSLSQNYPNPFNNRTTIEFTLAHRTAVSLTIHNMRGELVVTIAAGEFDAGPHRVDWQTTNVAAGTYSVKLKAGTFVDVKQLTVVK